MTEEEQEEQQPRESDSPSQEAPPVEQEEGAPPAEKESSQDGALGAGKHRNGGSFWLWLILLALLGGAAYLGWQWLREEWTPPSWVPFFSQATEPQPPTTDQQETPPPTLRLPKRTADPVALTEPPPATRTAPPATSHPPSATRHPPPATSRDPAIAETRSPKSAKPAPAAAATSDPAIARRLRQLQQRLSRAEERNLEQHQNLLHTRQELGDLYRKIENVELQVASGHLDAKTDSTELLAAISRLHQRQMLTQARFLLAATARPIHSPADAYSVRQVLKSVAQMLHSLEDAEFLPLRQALAEDMLHLRKLENLDITGSYLQLAAISEQLETLPFIPRDTPSRSSRRGSRQNQEEEETARGWQAILQTLREAVVVRRHKTTLPALPSMEQRELLLPRLQLQLEQAKLALLRGQRWIYQDHLESLAALLEAHFPPSLHPTSKAILDDLHDLGEQLKNLPEYPLQSDASLRALEEYLSRGDRSGTPTPGRRTQQRK